MSVKPEAANPPQCSPGFRAGPQSIHHIDHCLTMPIDPSRGAGLANGSGTRPHSKTFRNDEGSGTPLSPSVIPIVAYAGPVNGMRPCAIAAASSASGIGALRCRWRG
jgi:hypothetical protein